MQILTSQYVCEMFYRPQHHSGDRKRHGSTSNRQQTQLAVKPSTSAQHASCKRQVKQEIGFNQKLVTNSSSKDGFEKHEGDKKIKVKQEINECEVSSLEKELQKEFSMTETPEIHNVNGDEDDDIHIDINVKSFVQADYKKSQLKIKTSDSRKSASSPLPCKNERTSLSKAKVSSPITQKQSSVQLQVQSALISSTEDICKPSSKLKTEEQAFAEKIKEKTMYDAMDEIYGDEIKHRKDKQSSGSSQQKYGRHRPGSLDHVSERKRTSSDITSLRDECKKKSRFEHVTETVKLHKDDGKSEVEKKQDEHIRLREGSVGCKKTNQSQNEKHCTVVLSKLQPECSANEMTLTGKFDYERNKSAPQSKSLIESNSGQKEVKHIEKNPPMKTRGLPVEIKVDTSAFRLDKDHKGKNQYVTNRSSKNPPLANKVTHVTVDITDDVETQGEDSGGLSESELADLEDAFNEYLEELGDNDQG